MEMMCLSSTGKFKLIFSECPYSAPCIVCYNETNFCLPCEEDVHVCSCKCFNVAEEDGLLDYWRPTIRREKILDIPASECESHFVAPNDSTRSRA